MFPGRWHIDIERNLDVTDSLERQQPPLNPVLRFTKEALRENPPAGGKSRDKIVSSRLQTQRENLSNDLLQIANSSKLETEYRGVFLAELSMFDDSLATTWTPDSLFSRRRQVYFTRPTKNGYLIELRRHSLVGIAERIQTTASTSEQVDISRIRSITPFQPASALRGQSHEDIWNKALTRDIGRIFSIHLVPFHDDDAAEDLLSSFLKLQNENYRSLGPLVQLRARENLDESRALAQIHARGDRVSQFVRSYRTERKGSTSILVPSFDKFVDLVSTGTIFSIKPVRPLVGVNCSENHNIQILTLPDLTKSPIVGVVDGGLTAPEYETAVAWRLATRIDRSLRTKITETKHLY